MRTLTKAELIEQLMARLSLTKQQARLLVDGFFSEIATQLTRGNEVKLSGFGNFELKDKKARPGRNPKTGKPATVSARRVVTFRAGQKFRGRLE